MCVFFFFFLTIRNDSYAESEVQNYHSQPLFSEATITIFSATAPLLFTLGDE